MLLNTMKRFDGKIKPEQPQGTKYYLSVVSIVNNAKLFVNFADIFRYDVARQTLCDIFT